MKIGILTLPLHSNYGGILQAYALQTILQRQGHEVEVFQKIPGYSHKKFLMPIVYLKRIINNIINGQHHPIFLEKKKRHEDIIAQKNTSQFIDKYITLRHINNLTDIKSTDYEALITGSDQVWRNIYFQGMWNSSISNAFLNFTKGWNIKRIAYSASFGTDDLSEYTDKQIKQCSSAIQQFDDISVREESGIEICLNLLGVKASHTLDPTMLLNKEDYINLINNSTIPLHNSNGELFCYVLDKSQELNKAIEICAHNTKYNQYYCNYPPTNQVLNHDVCIYPPVEQWLKSFMDAKMVITDSFHGTVFSIIFNKPFWVLINKERGSARFISLLKKFGLEDRIVTDATALDWKQPINWDKINEIHNQTASFSEHFIHKSLGSL